MTSLINKLNAYTIANRPQHASVYYRSNKPQDGTLDETDLEASKIHPKPTVLTGEKTRVKLRAAKSGLGGNWVTSEILKK